MTQQVSQIITDAYRLIGVVDEEETPTPAQSNSALTLLNDMLLNEAADGLRLGWFPQISITANAPLRDEDFFGVKLMLAERLAPRCGIAITDPDLLSQIGDAKRQLTKRAIKYFESDLGELSRPQGGPWGGPWGIT